MKVNYLTQVAAATIVLLTAAAIRAEESAVSALTADANAAPGVMAPSASTAPVAPASANTVTYDNGSDPVADFIARAGVWAVQQSGSPTKVGEYQDLNSSPQFNVDGIWSNGLQTIDFSAEGDDNETRDGRLYYFGPRVEANLGYEGFLHQLDSKTYPGWTTIPAASATNGAGFNVASRNDLNPGQNYAIRVQEFKANFKGQLTDNLMWRVNVFGIDKEGYRQANDVSHCYEAGASTATLPSPFNTFPTNPTVNRQCHAVSQAQHIDWQTTQVDASLQLRLNCDTALEYSHLARAFTQNDGMVLSLYRSGGNGFPISPPAPNGAFSIAGYNIVPDSETQIDRLKFCTKFGANTDAYLLGYAGYNEDLLRDTYRNFNGTDLRITNTSIDTVQVTARGKYYRESTTNAFTPLNTLYPGAAGFYQEPNLAAITAIGPEINREVHSFGADARWTPFQDERGVSYLGGFALVGGYEYSTLMRENAFDVLTATTGGPFVGPGRVFTEPNSNANTFTVGVEERWSCKFETFLRYKNIETRYPLYGITPEAGSSVDGAINSSLPTQENRIELGCTWTPTDCLMVNATLYVENAMSDAPYVAWTSNSLPFTLSAWWSATPDWSFSAGAAEMDSWINQNVSMGPLNTTSTVGAISVPWNFTGVSDVLTFGSRYAATEKLSFTGEFEYVHGINTSFGVVPTASQTPATGAAYDLGQYSLVKMQSFRFGLGADYILRPRVTTYARYNYYDYQDLSTGLTSGQANMFLVGVSALF